MHLVKASLGSGLLALPYAISKVGYIVSLLVCVTVCAITCIVCTENEFNFIAPAYVVPSVLSLKCSLVCFSGGHLDSPS